MIREVRAVSVHADQEEIARMFKHYGFSVVPVVDDFQRLRGIVTSDDVMHILEEEATEDMQRMIGLSGEESSGTPWKDSVRKALALAVRESRHGVSGRWRRGDVRGHDRANTRCSRFSCRSSPGRAATRGPRC